MECSDDEISVALQKLKSLALQNGFTIFGVPYDGNCMFSAISHQLQTSDVCNVDSSELRQMVASHMEANAALYRGFVCQPVATNSKYNADTEPPTDEDEYINSVSDPELQTQLRWAKYVRRLRQGAWGGDHINFQAIADMLSVKINVPSCTYISRPPRRNLPFPQLVDDCVSAVAVQPRESVTQCGPVRFVSKVSH